MLRAIDEIRPAWVVGENVAGITTMVEGGILSPLGGEETLFGEVDGVQRYGLRQSFTIERICRDLEGLGYSVQPVLIPAEAVGAPHRRDRIFFLAHNDTDTENLFGDGGIAEYEGKFRGKSRPESGDSGRSDAAPFSESVGHEGRHDETEERYGTGTGRQIGQHGGVGASPITNGEGLQESKQPRRSENSEESVAGMDYRVERPRRDENPADSFRKRLEAALQRRCNDKKGRDGKGRYAFISSHDAWTEGTWWDNFPTVSPVHAGNDGLPIRMDGATLPASMQPKNYRNSDRQRYNFGRWRTESLKAYGNAIVPQVMYRIFQAIGEVCR